MIPKSSFFRLYAASFVGLLCLVGYSQQQLIPYGSQQTFDLVNQVTIVDLKNPTLKDVSYTLKAILTVDSVWHSKKQQLLRFFFSETIISAPRETGGALLKQKIPKIDEKPFYVTIENGKVINVLAHSSRDQSFLNLKRGIASLLQLQFEQVPVAEVDVSGRCNVFYAAKSSTKFEKTKTDCSHWDLKVHYRSEVPLGVSQISQHKMDFDLTADGSLLKVESHETHRMALHAKPDVGSEVESDMSLKHIAIVGESVKQLSFSTLDEIVASLLEDYRVFDMEADVDGAVSEIRGTTLKKQIASHKAQLADENIGKESLAVLFANLLPLARITKSSEFVEILQSKSGKEIQNQLIDLLGAVQTIDAHNAILEVFKFDAIDADDALEKYLQSLAVGTHPDYAIVEDLFARSQDAVNPIKNEKLFDSLIQTIASLAHQSTLSSDNALFVQIREYLLAQLSEKCSNIECKVMFIRALQNLQDPTTIPVLISLATDGDVKTSVAAIQALRSFSVRNFNDNHRKAFEELFYQRKRKYDSSARTMALDILLEMRPTKCQLGDFLAYLASNDRHFEVKTYLLQKLRMIAEKCTRFSALLRQAFSERSHVNNYHVLAQKGLTTALHRKLSQSPAYNESLLSIQEIYQGVLKRGSVELILSAGREETSTFKLGIYTNGMTSLVGDSDVDVEDTDTDAPATAGMEISVQGVLLRPLVFFTGQSELMGHVWSGTASDPTPAFQATMLVQDYEHYVILQSGATIYLRVIGTKSIDLNGQVTMSIWNRNAHTEINQNTGTGVVGLMTVGTSFAKLENQFTLATEPKISLVADIDFYSGIKLCIQLGRPEMVLSHHNARSVSLSAERKFINRIKTKLSYKSPGKTLALNRKNNEMCNMIFS